MSSLNRIITAHNTKRMLVENEWNNLKTFDSSYFIGKVILKKMAHKII